MTTIDLEIDWVDINEALDELEAELTDVCRGLSVRVWNSVLSKTPQFMGRMAASWNYTIGTPEYVDRSGLVDPLSEKLPSHRFNDLGEFRGLYRGHPFAIEIANNACAGRDQQFKLGDTVWITNGVDHGEGPYSGEIEEGNVNLRPENRPGMPVARTEDMVDARYAEISQAQAETLRHLTIGDNGADSDS